ncbi:MAG: class I SAM-dependent rRNA methyltransferase [Deltaproteobacteria bacterium]|nr:class I SAM-dependent rRNA methyltransferase [Deltaproteobacteria bacterium]
MQDPCIWRLKNGLDKRFRSGHPWVYSNELASSPKGIDAGQLIELQDKSGHFLAKGYGNPHSLIAFRALSRNPQVVDPMSPDWVTHALVKAACLRRTIGLSKVSHRLCFGEADGIPGLVIDRYRTESGQVFVVQAHTAGAQRICNSILGILETYTGDVTTDVPWDKTSVVLRNDIGARKLEGLEEEAPNAIKEVDGVDLSAQNIFVASAARGDQALLFSVDLLSGQKTGFFLDQAANIELAVLRFKDLFRHGDSPIKILDLFCYVGQWGTQLGSALKRDGLNVSVTAADASAKALEFAKKNLARNDLPSETLKADLIRGLASIPDKSFDIVICDPPALIKSRKDIASGSHAYLQLATQVFRIIKEGGGVVCCSCSQLLQEERFLEALAKGSRRNHRLVKWIARGTPSADHPMLAEFPEGRYLKAWIGIADG